MIFTDRLQRNTSRSMRTRSECFKHNYDKSSGRMQGLTSRQRAVMARRPRLSRMAVLVYHDLAASCNLGRLHQANRMEECNQHRHERRTWSPRS